MRSRGLWIALAALAVGVALAALAWWNAEADRLDHGGEEVHATADVAAVEPRLFHDVATSLGVPPDRPAPHRVSQAVVAKVTWDPGTLEGDSALQVLVLDGRVSPPAPLRAVEGWWSGGSTGSGWSSTYDVLARDYPWLARTAPSRVAGGWRNDTMAVGVPAQVGRATVVFALPRGGIPVEDAARELVVGMFHVVDDEVQWATRVPLTTVDVEDAAAR